jgi:hypothetical protein
MPYEFILGVIAIVMIAHVIKTIAKNNPRIPAPRPDPEAGRLRDEVKVLKDRIAVLERIATDKSSRLEHEIEELRDR